MLNPAHAIIQKCGGTHKVAAIVGRHPSRVFRWTRPRELGGTGGLIPSDLQQCLLEGARAAGVDLTPDDFFNFAPVAGDEAA